MALRLMAAAQRFALLALGRAWIMFGSRKNTKPEKCLKMPQNPQRPVHAVLGGLIFSYAFCSSAHDGARSRHAGTPHPDRRSRLRLFQVDQIAIRVLKVKPFYA